MLRSHALQEMAADLGPEVARDFAVLYLESLDERLTRLRAALAEDDPTATFTSAVSLYTASWMVGAVALAEEARMLADLARHEELGRARRRFPLLERRVPDALTDLRQAISELASAGIPLHAQSR